MDGETSEGLFPVEIWFCVVTLLGKIGLLGRRFWREIECNDIIISILLLKIILRRFISLGNTPWPFQDDFKDEFYQRLQFHILEDEQGLGWSGAAGKMNGGFFCLILFSLFSFVCCFIFVYGVKFVFSGDTKWFIGWIPSARAVAAY